MSELIVSPQNLNRLDPRRKLQIIVADGVGLATFIVKLDQKPAHRTPYNGQCNVLLSEDTASGFTAEEVPTVVQTRVEVGRLWAIYNEDGSVTAYQVVELTLLP